jgi:hypothetical protein
VAISSFSAAGDIEYTFEQYHFLSPPQCAETELTLCSGPFRVWYYVRTFRVLLPKHAKQEERPKPAPLRPHLLLCARNESFASLIAPKFPRYSI